MKQTQRKQTLVKLESKTKGEAFIKWLEENGYSNVQNLSYDSLRIKILVVDSDSKIFFGTNVTCLAILASSDIHPIDSENFTDSIQSQID